MDRSFAARLGIGAVSPGAVRAGRHGSGAARESARGARTRGRRAARPTAIDRAIALLWSAPAALARLLARVWTVTRVHRRARIALVVATVATPLLAGGWLWLRDSSLVAVRDVRVVGAHGADAVAIDTALTSAARKMSTLDVNTGELRAAVASYPIVGAIEVHASFPHSLRIRVTEQPPVAVVSIDGVKTALAADGVVLGPAHASGALATVQDPTQLSTGEHVHNAALLGALSVLGAAPSQLAGDVERAYSGSKGLTLALRGGVLAFFGDATLAHAKWLSLARVLADSGARGASYVDVRVPERPAAGFAPGVTPPALGGEAGQPEAEASTSGATSESSQALAEGLSSAVGANASTSGASASPATSEHEEAPSGEARSTASGGEATAARGEEAAPSSGERAVAAGGEEVGTTQATH